jgi:hypothetical protein
MRWRLPVVKMFRQTRCVDRAVAGSAKRLYRARGLPLAPLPRRAGLPLDLGRAESSLRHALTLPRHHDGRPPYRRGALDRSPPACANAGGSSPFKSHGWCRRSMTAMQLRWPCAVAHGVPDGTFVCRQRKTRRKATTDGIDAILAKYDAACIRKHLWRHDARHRAPLEYASRAGVRCALSINQRGAVCHIWECPSRLPLVSTRCSRPRRRRVREIRPFFANADVPVHRGESAREPNCSQPVLARNRVTVSY